MIIQPHLDNLGLIPIGVGGGNSNGSVLLIELEQRLCLGPINEISRLGRELRLNGLMWKMAVAPSDRHKSLTGTELLR